jgi:3-oxoacyl-[acyl-carrier protein] reductase
MQKLLLNKVCIVTGAKWGIGKAIVEQFALEGARVYANAHKEGDLDWITEFNAANGTTIFPAYFDVTDTANAKKTLMSVFKQEGKIDCLINNAAVISNNVIGMITRTDMEQMFAVNVFAVIELIQIVSRLMLRSGGGSIINIASVVGIKGSIGQMAYGASKGAVVALTKSAAKELAPMKIRVNAVAPGLVNTERLNMLNTESVSYSMNKRIEQITLGRLGTPLDIANACVFLASDKAGYISGQTLCVDGDIIM